MKKIIGYRIIEPAPLPVRLWVMFALALLVLLLVVSSPTLAQDATDEPLVTNTPAVTEAAPTVEPVATPAPVDPVKTTLDLSTVVGAILAAAVGFISGAGITGGILLAVVRNFNESQKEAIRRLYASIPVDKREAIRDLLRDADELIEFGKDVTTDPATS